MKPIQPNWTVEKANLVRWALTKAADETYVLASRSERTVKARLSAEADELMALAEELGTLTQAAVNKEKAV